jgi:hypothetical protein
VEGQYLRAEQADSLRSVGLRPLKADALRWADSHSLKAGSLCWADSHPLKAGSLRRADSHLMNADSLLRADSHLMRADSLRPDGWLVRELRGQGRGYCCRTAAALLYCCIARPDDGLGCAAKRFLLAG